MLSRQLKMKERKDLTMATHLVLPSFKYSHADVRMHDAESPAKSGGRYLGDEREKDVHKQGVGAKFRPPPLRCVPDNPGCTKSQPSAFKSFKFKEMSFSTRTACLSREKVLSGI